MDDITLYSKLKECTTLEDILNLLREIQVWEQDYVFTGLPCDIRHAIKKGKTSLDETEQIKTIDLLDSIYDSLESFCNSKCPFPSCSYSHNECGMFKTYRTSLWKRILEVE